MFIDDIENLVDQMARRHGIEFAKEFGLCTVRPGYANTAHNFFSNVLTTHRDVAHKLSNAWGEAGLSSIARLDPTSPNSVELPLPGRDQAREIVVAHLDYYRVDQGDRGTVKPFTEEGINVLLGDQQMLRPRLLLRTAADVVSKAMEEGVTIIEAATVKSAIDGSPTLATRDFSEDIDDAI